MVVISSHFEGGDPTIFRWPRGRPASLTIGVLRRVGMELRLHGAMRDRRPQSSAWFGLHKPATAGPMLASEGGTSGPPVHRDQRRRRPARVWCATLPPWSRGGPACGGPAHKPIASGVSGLQKPTAAGPDFAREQWPTCFRLVRCSVRQAVCSTLPLSGRQRSVSSRHPSAAPHRTLDFRLTFHSEPAGALCQ